jgi:urease accessory protein
MRTRLLAALALVLIPSAAFAHPGDAHGFATGFAHPFGGYDHLMAMIAVGLFAWQLGGRALWLVPATFVTIMAAGGALGIAGVAIPGVEIGIAASVVVLAGVVALRMKTPVVLAMALVGVFAVFHGHAHGSEMPLDASGAFYAGGFLAATALLHAAGITLGMLIAKTRATWRASRPAPSRI